MTNNNFIGREFYLDLLRSKDYSKSSTITALYGRRRIGKTTLVEQAFKKSRLIKFEGIEGASEQEQREHFAETLYRTSGMTEHKLLDTTSWNTLLLALSSFLKLEPTVVFFDEYQWLSAEKSSLTSYLKYAWDNFFLKENRVHLIICGSVSTFIVKKVIRSKALYGRIDNFIELSQLSLSDTVNKFFKSSANFKNSLNIYLAVGGVPKYLELFDKAKSFEQNIELLCLNKEGYLVKEIDRLFVSHFGKNKFYKQIIKILSKTPHLTQNGILKKLKISSGGRLSEILEDLELAGFIDRYTPLQTSDSSHLKRYRICDSYLRFYFRFIEPNLKKISSSRAKLIFSNVIKSSELEIWKGLAFEQCIRDNQEEVARLLGFSGIMYTSGSWYKKRDQETGFQIDLAFLRKDKIITLCEVKYVNKITSVFIQEIADKEARLLDEMRPDGIQKVLITVDPVDQSIVRDGSVDRCISLKELLKGS